MVASLQQDDPLGKLARYEATFQRGIFKYLELLLRLRKDGGQPGEERIIEAETVEAESEDSPPPALERKPEVQPDVSPSDQTEPAPAADRAITSSDAQGNPGSDPAGNGSLQTNPGSEVEPQSPE